jgi:hypothetical protein
MSFQDKIRSKRVRALDKSDDDQDNLDHISRLMRIAIESSEEEMLTESEQEENDRKNKEVYNNSILQVDGSTGVGQNAMVEGDNSFFVRVIGKADGSQKPTSAKVMARRRGAGSSRGK